MMIGLVGQVWEKLEPLVSAEARPWLRDATSPL
jgi:hypothetical protein